MSPRFAWVGESRKAAVHATVAECLQTWICDWCLLRGPNELKVEAAVLPDGCVSESRGALFESERGCLLVVACGDRLARLGTRLAGVVADDGAGLATDVAAAALEDCARCVAACGEMSGAVTEWRGSVCPPALSRAEWGAVWIRVTFDRLEFLVGLDRNAVQAICPQRQLEAAPLKGRDRSVESAFVELNAIMAFGEVGICDLADLREGDVLVGERRLDETIELRTPEGHVLARAKIGRLGAHKAVVAVAADARQEET